MWQMASLVGYARVSTESQAERQTIEQQVESLTRYAHEHGWDLDRGDIYRDEGFSGARLDRPGLDRLRDAVSSGEVDTILVASPDRLARRYAYQVWLLEEFERAGCRVVFLEHPLSDDPQDALLVQIRGAVAEYERTVIADRMRRGRLAALAAGRMLPWSAPPFGYRADPLRPRAPEALQVDEGEAWVVRRVFESYVEEGLSLYAIARHLTEEGVPTAKGRAVWSPSTVHKILTNSAYSGVAYGNRKRRVVARRRYPLLGREPKGERAEQDSSPQGGVDRRGGAGDRLSRAL
jgi:site-specific DNA recombinase